MLSFLKKEVKCQVFQRIFNDKAFLFPMALNHFGQLFNFCIFIKLFIYKVKKT